MTTPPPFEGYEEPPMEKGDEWSPKDHYGSVVIAKVVELKHDVKTSNSKKDPVTGEKIGAPALIVELVDLDGPDPTRVYRDVLWMGGAFVDGLKAKAPGGASYTGRPIVLTIGKRISGEGRPYPIPVAADDAANERAAAYYAKYGDPFVQRFDSVSAEATPPF